jgi:hypothetical protein
MASDPHLRQVPERLRVLASVPQRGPVSLLLLLALLLFRNTRLLAVSQLARLSRDKVSAKMVLLTRVLGSPQTRVSLVRRPSRFSLDPNVRVA